jgi:hypothetical protein
MPITPIISFTQMFNTERSWVCIHMMLSSTFVFRVRYQRSRQSSKRFPVRSFCFVARHFNRNPSRAVLFHRIVFVPIDQIHQVPKTTMSFGTISPHHAIKRGESTVSWYHTSFHSNKREPRDKVADSFSKNFWLWLIIMTDHTLWSSWKRKKNQANSFWLGNENQAYSFWLGNKR